MIRRPPRSTQSRSSAASDVYKRQALAGADAHAKIAPRNVDPRDNRLSLPLPSYEASFRMMSVHVRTDAALTGDAAADAALVVRALRAGHLYVVIDGAATPPA